MSPLSDREPSEAPLSPEKQYECGHGPLNPSVDGACANCWSWCSSSSIEGWVRGLEEEEEEEPTNISPPSDQEPHSKHAALPMTTTHVLHNHNTGRRASTPFADTGSAISHIELTSPTVVPYQPEQTRIVDVSTIGIRASTQPETPAQQSDPITSEQWSLSRYEDGHLPALPIHEPFGNSSLPTEVLSEYYASPRYPNGLPDYIGTPYSLIAAQAVSDWPADYFEQSTIEPNSSNTAVEPITGINLSYVADDSIAIDTCMHKSPNNTPTSSKKGRITKLASKHYKCCKSNGSPRLACLFYKYDHDLHANCALKKFSSIGHLRQHLNKRHKLGPNHCKSCWRTFGTADSLTRHRYCVPTGGVPVDRLPEFPRMRLPADKKWYWGWKKLFGEAIVPPQCPYYHPPLKNFKAQSRLQSPELSPLEGIVGGWPPGNGSTSYLLHTKVRSSLASRIEPV
ncbi:hypothetical protein F4825DRAFT_475309 [Nemania diffusa]|nr:hypothetical protein F4825DRAFT_475309 [Nemania diffusa]